MTFSLRYLLLLPLQGPFVLLCLCSTGVSWWMFWCKRNRRPRLFVLFACLPLVFCGHNVVYRHHQNVLINDYVRAGQMLVSKMIRANCVVQ